MLYIYVFLCFNDNCETIDKTQTLHTQCIFEYGICNLFGKKNNSQNPYKEKL